MDQVISLLEHYRAVISNNLEIALPVAAFIYEFVRRLMPTKNPGGLIHDFKYLMLGLKKILEGLIKLFSIVIGLISELAGFIDKVVPVQNLKPAPEIKLEENK